MIIIIFNNAFARDFAVVLDGSTSVRDPLQLAELFKEGGLDDKRAFIAPTKQDVPQGQDGERERERTFN